MVMFWPIQQELDCISDSGDVLGRIKFDGSKTSTSSLPWMNPLHCLAINTQKSLNAWPDSPRVSSQSQCKTMIEAEILVCEANSTGPQHISKTSRRNTK